LPPKSFVLWTKNNAGASVWATWKLKAKMMMIKARTRWRSTLRTCVTTTTLKSVWIRLKVRKKWGHQPVLMNDRTGSFRWSMTWTLTWFMNQVLKKKSPPPEFNFPSSSWISPASSTKTFSPYRTFLLWTLTKNKPFWNT
jgi:hypothetical protein